jgi:hypothetical protein
MKNPVAEIKTEIPVADIKAQNPVKPIERRNLVRATRPQRHPIYDRPKPPPSNALVIVLGVIFWPIALALYVLKNATANRFRP